MAYEFDKRNKWAARGRVLAVIAMLLVCVLIGAFFVWREVRPQQSEQPPQTSEPSGSVQDPDMNDPHTVITITVGGDVNVTDQVVNSGFVNGVYDYTGAFLDVSALLSDADATILNFEGNLCGAPYGSASTSAPQELVQALAASGVDFLQAANSCSINNGLTGLSATLAGIRQAGMEPLGAFSSTQEFENTQGFTIRNIGGIRVALVAFTKGMGSLGLPAGSQDCVNLLYKDYASTYQKVDTEGITAVLQAVQAQKPDITVALLHWGSEYNDNISKTQKAIVKLMQENGVDAILGTHPHYVQQVDFDRTKGSLVAWSLGDFYGDSARAGSQYSILLKLTVSRNDRTGETKVIGWDYEPIYILTPDRDGEAMRVVRIRETMAMYENNHIGKVSQQAYENMKAALARIEARIQGK